MKLIYMFHRVSCQYYDWQRWNWLTCNNYCCDADSHQGRWNLVLVLLKRGDQDLKMKEKKNQFVPSTTYPVAMVPGQCPAVMGQTIRKYSNCSKLVLLFGTSWETLVLGSHIFIKGSDKPVQKACIFNLNNLTVLYPKCNCLPATLLNNQCSESLITKVEQFVGPFLHFEVVGIFQTMNQN